MTSTCFLFLFFSWDGVFAVAFATGMTAVGQLCRIHAEKVDAVHHTFILLFSKKVFFLPWQVVGIQVWWSLLLVVGWRTVIIMCLLVGGWKPPIMMRMAILRYPCYGCLILVCVLISACFHPVLLRFCSSQQTPIQM